MINILLWIIFGGLAGWIASIVVSADVGIGLLGNIILGIIGALVGGWVADKMGVGGEPGAERPTSLMSFFWAVVGAILVLLLLNFILFLF